MKPFLSIVVSIFTLTLPICYTYADEARSCNSDCLISQDGLLTHTNVVAALKQKGYVVLGDPESAGCENLRHVDFTLSQGMQKQQYQGNVIRSTNGKSLVCEGEVFSESASLEINGETFTADASQGHWFSRRFSINADGESSEFKTYHNHLHQGDLSELAMLKVIRRHLPKCGEL